MELYRIDLPYFSKNFTRSYNKTLEVHEGTVRDESDLNCVVDFHTTHTYVKGEWVNKSCTLPTYQARGISVHKSNISTVASIDRRFFYSKDCAIVSKLLAIGSLKTGLEESLSTIRTKALKNVPGVDLLLSKYQKSHPELFI